MATENFCKFIVVCFSIWMVTSEDIVIDNEEALSVSAAEPKTEFEWDPKGYVMFCLCMGTFRGAPPCVGIVLPSYHAY